MKRIPITAELYRQALKYGYVMDLGGISASTKRDLDRRCKSGKVVKTLGFFPDLIVGFSPPKTIYVATQPNALNNGESS